MLSKQELLERAKKHCFFVGLNDSGAELCKVNTPYGIAALHYIQEKLGLKPDATFISSPDMTITRNSTRWKSGFGYGGKLVWGDGSQEFTVLNVKPNACGMLAGGLEKLPDIDNLIRKLHEMETSENKVEGYKVEWDFYKSNHFIDVFEVKPVAGSHYSVPPYAFILHGSASEFRRDNELGFGIYFDKSKKLLDMAEKIKTPFGLFYVLTGKNARDFFERYKFTEKFSEKKRELAAKLLFGEYMPISNETHQGLLNMNTLIMGCHNIKDSHSLFPLALRADLPAYLVRGVFNYTPETIQVLGFEQRAKEMGVYQYLLDANIVPHGGGYVLPDILGVNKVIEVNGNRYFEVEMQNDRGKQIISEVRELPYEYRGRNVILRSLEIRSLEIMYKLIPKFVLKM